MWTNERTALPRATLLTAAFVLSLAGPAGAADRDAPRFSCFGTEPFWETVTRDGHLEYRSPSDEPSRLPITKTSAYAGMTAAGGSVFRSKEAALYTIPSRCSDGMSDVPYDWTAIFDLKDEARFGCCRVITVVSVTGVAKGDVLNIRERPDASSRVLAGIPHDAKDVECFDCGRCKDWCQVERKGVRGFVKLRYLRLE